MRKEDDFKLETLAIHAGQPPDPHTGAVMTPITLSSTFAQKSPGNPGMYEYSRSDNPTRHALEKCIASLEQGSEAFAFASGCAAMSAVVHAFLKPGDHIVSCDDVYGGTARLLDRVYGDYGVETSWSDLTNAENLGSAIKENTKLVWLETPTNPLLKIIDIKNIAKICKQKGILCVVDNTFATPFLQQPLLLGVDIVLHSTTKYMNGHSDLVGGAVVVNNADLGEKLRFVQNAVGAIPSPFDAYMLLRGIKTLHVRMQRHCDNATELSNWLQGQDEISRVIYPGLPSHPQHQVAKDQMKLPGGMLGFVLKAGAKGASKLLSALEIFTCAESLGGVESLIEVPALMTHAGISSARREEIGIEEGLVRVSVGIEHIEDLKLDLKHGLGSLSN